jgi:hypothetical protein
MATPTVFVLAGGTTYSFPACAFTWDGVHNLFEIPLPKTLDETMAAEVGAMIKSLNLVTESARLVGNWKGAGGQSARARAIAFVEYFMTSQEPAVLSWGLSDTLTRNVFLKEWHFDEVPGEGDMLQYNIVLSAARTTIS